MSRNAFVYSSLALGTITAAVLALHSAFAALIEDEAAARIITAIVASFTLGAMSAILVVYFGARIQPAVGETAKELPPRRLVFDHAQSDPIPSVSVIEHGAEVDYQPRVLVNKGIARLLDDPANKRRSSVVEWVELDPKQGRYVYRQIDLATLRRFARLHTPCRAEWTGKATTYTEALAFFRHAHWIQLVGEGRGVEWVTPYTKLNRRLAYLGDTAAVATLPQPRLSPRRLAN